MAGTRAKLGGIADAVLPGRCHLAEPTYYPPEFFADFTYSPSFDVYTFGMTLLSIVTLCLPYEECATLEAHVSALKHGRMPETLYRIAEPEALAIIEACLRPASQRPSAAELQEFDFITNTKGGDIAMRQLSEAHREVDVAPGLRLHVAAKPAKPKHGSHAAGGSGAAAGAAGAAAGSSSSSLAAADSIGNGAFGDSSSSSLLSLQVGIVRGNETQAIRFKYRPQTDRPEEVVREMQRDLDIEDALVPALTECVADVTSALGPRSGGLWSGVS